MTVDGTKKDIFATYWGRGRGIGTRQRWVASKCGPLHPPDV